MAPSLWMALVVLEANLLVTSSATTSSYSSASKEVVTSSPKVKETILPPSFVQYHVLHPIVVEEEIICREHVDLSVSLVDLDPEGPLNGFIFIVDVGPGLVDHMELEARGSGGRAFTVDL